jgi:opacity protein-like surface antigen
MKPFLLACLLIPGLASAQRWHIDVTGGLSNYSGDLQARYFTLDQSNFAFGAGAQYDITRNLSVRSMISLMKVGASDQFNRPNLQFRNLSFQSSIVEWNLLGEYTFFDITRSKISPFIFAGIAAFHFNPYAFDSTGNKIYLKPLSTEGEGLSEYPGRKPYNLLQFAIPLGAGIKFRVSENIVLAYEIGFRKTFTDYLDDVSTRYVDPAVLLTERGPKAVEMAYRAGELKGGNTTYPTDGTVRGGERYKDVYYYTGIRVSIALISHHDPNFGRGRTDCPKPVL